MKFRIALLTLLLILAGCGHSGDSSEGGEAGGQREKTGVLSLPGCPVMIDRSATPRQLAISFSRLGIECRASQEQVDSLIEQL